MLLLLLLLYVLRNGVAGAVAVCKAAAVAVAS